ncbi:MAG: NAD-dependent epimerase/dehydratase family protein [Candidatus Aminicenantes bacterium]|jgi:nucleoside-diphosphate-sugar epimerase
MKKILITGAFGQIGTELGVYLQHIMGTENIVLTDIRLPEHNKPRDGIIEYLDVTDKQAAARIIDQYEIDTIYHMAALLSGAGELKPDKCWNVNINGLKNVLDIAREKKLIRVFVPSSIAAFGPDTPKTNTPQETVLSPTTMYGITKVTGELLSDYYVKKYHLDVRGIRYPGIISSEVVPYGGTTDYAVEIFHQAIKTGSYKCFLKEDTVLPMMYLPDAIKGTVELMQTDFDRLIHHTNFNITAFSFSPARLAAEIKKHIPGFTISYEPDYRQSIAESWPQTIDDSTARKEWNWKPHFTLEKMVADMMHHLRAKLK